MVTRRDYLRLSMAAGAGVLYAPRLLWGRQQTGALITRRIPSSGEQLPVVGLGSSATFSSAAGAEEIDTLEQVFRVFVEQGGSVFDTAPSYGASEAVAGKIVNDLHIADRVFLATKLNVAGYGEGKADATQARAQLDASFNALGKSVIDLIQVHNLGRLADAIAAVEVLARRKTNPLHGRYHYISSPVRTIGASDAHRAPGFYQSGLRDRQPRHGTTHIAAGS